VERNHEGEQRKSKVKRTKAEEPQISAEKYTHELAQINTKLKPRISLKARKRTIIISE